VDRWHVYSGRQGSDIKCDCHINVKEEAFGREASGVVIARHRSVMAAAMNAMDVMVRAVLMGLGRTILGSFRWSGWLLFFALPACSACFR
jgi:hypothetical protein